MKIAVIGNGLIGRQLATRLAARGVDATAYGRDDGIDTTTGAGLAEALAGADVSVDLTNSPSWADEDVLAFFRDSSTNLVRAADAAGVGHHVILSIVGADRLTDSGYMRGKLAQEAALETGTVPYTIVRSTQFFEFVPGIADAGASGDGVRVTDAALQPLASSAVVERLSDIVVGPAADGRVEIAGPERIGIDHLVRRYFAATGDSRRVIVDRAAGYFGARLDDDALTPAPSGGAWLSELTYDDWLRSQA
ncbi:SDR family oxidoreductase [Gordonia sp. PDNC005]|uniref:SDR family oxidoreductase n=1 Tax=unclassified Gordonia (in: high G+C Gram-positive bacteria) TaxID=2657482 RepID=UPI001964B109|nr:NAD(P)H-binding protein [Gordonia sp. PDNC005]QRY62948.1 SDR family oxidoreductase [Gordonia sp. PDNC005]